MTWLVFEASADSHGTDRLWAWCKPWGDTPGFAEVWTTKTNGVDLVSMPDDLRLGKFLFEVS